MREIKGIISWWLLGAFGVISDGLPAFTFLDQLRNQESSEFEFQPQQTYSNATLYNQMANNVDTTNYEEISELPKDLANDWLGLYVNEIKGGLTEYLRFTNHLDTPESDTIHRMTVKAANSTYRNVQALKIVLWKILYADGDEIDFPEIYSVNNGNLILIRCPPNIFHVILYAVRAPGDRAKASRFFFGPYYDDAIHVTDSISRADLKSFYQRRALSNPAEIPRTPSNTTKNRRQLSANNCSTSTLAAENHRPSYNTGENQNQNPPSNIDEKMNKRVESPRQKKQYVRALSLSEIESSLRRLESSMRSSTLSPATPSPVSGIVNPGDSKNLDPTKRGRSRRNLPSKYDKSEISRSNLGNISPSSPSVNTVTQYRSRLSGTPTSKLVLENSKSRLTGSVSPNNSPPFETDSAEARQVLDSLKSQLIPYSPDSSPSSSNPSSSLKKKKQSSPRSQEPYPKRHPKCKSNFIEPMKTNHENKVGNTRRTRSSYPSKIKPPAKKPSRTYRNRVPSSPASSESWNSVNLETPQSSTQSMHSNPSDVETTANTPSKSSDVSMKKTYANSPDELKTKIKERNSEDKKTNKDNDNSKKITQKYEKHSRSKSLSTEKSNSPAPSINSEYDNARKRSTRSLNVRKVTEIFGSDFVSAYYGTDSDPSSENSKEKRETNSKNAKS